MSEHIPVIEAKNLVKTYGEGEGLMYALNDVSVTVYEHDFLVILGGSGSGKSTLLSICCGPWKWGRPWSPPTKWRWP